MENTPAEPRVRIWIDDDGVIRLEARGVLDGDTLIRAHEEFYRESWEGYAASPCWLADYRECDYTQLTAHHVQALAARSREISKLRTPLRVAVLVDEGLGFGLARMWEQFAASTGWELGVFTTPEKAWDWLDADGRAVASRSRSPQDSP